MPKSSNYTISGASLHQFVRTVLCLERHGWLWSSVCDKIGDWLVSTEDFTPLDELKAALTADGVNCDIVEYGELKTLLSEVEEFKNVLDRKPCASVEL